MTDDSRAELIAGTVVLAVAAGFLAFAAGPRLMPGGGYDLIAAFPNVEGIEKGSEIRLAGVPVGRVTDITLNPQTYYAEARLRLPDTVLLPSDSAASSRMGTPWRLQIARIASMSALWPYRLTTTTQRGMRFSRRAHSKARSSAAGDRFQVPGSESMNTGRAPQ